MANVLDTLTGLLNFDTSGSLSTYLQTWTEADIYTSFERMMTVDDHVRGGMNVRKTAALSFPWQVLPATDDASETTRAQEVAVDLEALDIADAATDLWNAIPFGYAVCEVVWEVREGRTVPVKLIATNPRFCEIKAEGVIIKQSGKADIRTWEYPNKFIIFRYAPLFDSPAGNPVLAGCYWPWMFKRMGFKFWGVLLEKFGIPSLVALLDSDNPVQLPTDENGVTIGTVENAILAELAKLKSGGNCAMNGVKGVTVLEANGRGDDYQMFLAECNNAISKMILGNTMTMDAQSRGSQALGTVHAKISEDVAKGDALALAKIINVTLIRWIVDLNYGIDVPAPIFTWDMDGETSWDAVLAALDRGVPVSKKAIYEKIRGYEPEDESDAFTVATSQQDPGVGMSTRPFVLPSLPGRRKTQ